MKAIKYKCPKESLMKKYYYTIPGEPVAKQGDRSFVNYRTGKICHYQPKKITSYKQVIQSYLLADRQLTIPLNCPLKVSITAFVSRPKSRSKSLFPDVKPDLDNLAKMILDAMQGIIYTNDSRICDLKIAKRYACGIAPQVIIAIEEIEEEKKEG